MRLAEVAVVLLALFGAVVPIPPRMIERWFSSGWYPPLQSMLTPATNLIPFAVLDVLLVAAIAWVAVALIRAVRMSWGSRRVRPVLAAAWHLACAAALAYVLFLVLWGFNYRRVPMADRLVVAPGPPSSRAVAELALRAAGELNRLHRGAHTEGWAGGEWRNAPLRRAFAGVQSILSDAPPAVPGRLKGSILGPYFRWAGVDGMINPFGLEVLANPDLLPFERPFVAAHEWAHLAGYADEAEASFVGWLTCLRSGVPAQYSGWLFLYWQASGEVGERDRRRIGDALDPGPRRDVEAIADRLRRGRWPMLQTAGWAIYDRYLRANRVDEGIRSYGAVITLILRARFEDGWTPVRRPPAFSR